MKKKMPGVPAPPDDDSVEQEDYTAPLKPNMGDVIRKLHENTKRSIRPNPNLTAKRMRNRYGE
jgi:hypothetical protein